MAKKSLSSQKKQFRHQVNNNLFNSTFKILVSRSAKSSFYPIDTMQWWFSAYIRNRWIGRCWSRWMGIADVDNTTCQSSSSPSSAQIIKMDVCIEDFCIISTHLNRLMYHFTSSRHIGQILIRFFSRDISRSVQIK